MALKNWTVKTKQIKKKEMGLRNYKNYLFDTNRASHSGTTPIDLSKASFCLRNIIQQVEDRQEYRRENSLRGGGVSNYATSFVLSLPTDVKQPTPEEWKKIAINAVRDIAKLNDLDPNMVWRNSIAVLHQEESKPTHLHLTVSNVFNNEVIKGITQKRTTKAVKDSFNASMLKLGVDYNEYSPKRSKEPELPPQLAREQRIDSKLEELDRREEEIVQKLSDSINKLFKQLKGFFKAFKINDEVKEKDSLKGINLTITETPRPLQKELIKTVKEAIQDEELEREPTSLNSLLNQIEEEAKKTKRKRARNKPLTYKEKRQKVAEKIVKKGLKADAKGKPYNLKTVGNKTLVYAFDYKKQEYRKMGEVVLSEAK